MALFAAILIGLLFLTETQLAKSTDDIPLAGHLLLFGLLSVVILLLILMIFFLIRNLFKLFFERRRNILGSNIKTRLSLAFVALTLIPTVVLFIASAGVLHTTIESWFKTQVEDSLQSALVVAQTYYQYAAEKVLSSASRLAGAIQAESLLDPSHQDYLKKYIRDRLSLEGISSVQIYFADASPPLLIKDASINQVAVPPPPPSFLKIGFGGNETSQIIPLEGGSDLIRGIVPIKGGSSGSQSAVLVADYYIPTSLATRLLTVSTAYGDYQEAKRMRGPIKTIYILILLVVALLVIFIGFWFGMTMARDITDPILSLAEGTEKIAAGDLDVHIEPTGDDELSVLVKSFNKMAEDLRKGRDDLIRMNLDLESRRKYMETILRNIAAGVLALDAEQRISAVNNSARIILGIEESDVVGRPYEDALPQPSASMVKNALDELFRTEKEIVEQQVTLTFPRHVVTLLCFFSRLRDEDGRDMGFVLVCEDITYLLKAQRMAAWREVARRIAHEIKNPLTPIQLNAQRLRKKYMDRLHPDSDVLDRCTRTIIDQVEVLKNMVNEFSRFARMPAATLAPNDINELVEEVVELYAEGSEGTIFRSELDPNLPLLAIDKEQMKRAIVNLMDNAAAAVGPDGEVIVRTRYNRALSLASIEVSDNGPGIDPQDKDRLFEPYFSRRPGGTGLGLTIVNTIVADHNGFVRIRDNAEKGVTFVIELPVKRQVAQR
ncbi:MAG: sensor histidine kinase [Desulfomonilaceae bacterium]